MRTFFNFVAGALLGALVGAATAILLAPSSGNSLREELRGRGDKFIDQLRSAASEQRVELEEQLERLRGSY
jgi:gas vesicle protein